VRLQGSTIVVTGGARGIGAAISRELCRRGARVVIADLDAVLAEQTAASCGALATPHDVTSSESWRALISNVGSIDGLVSNAGLMPIARLLDEPEATMRRQLDLNIAGVILGCRAVLPGMLQRRRGVLVNIASQAGKAGFGGLTTYHATKFAVVGFSQALEDELHGTGVGVSCILPGVVNTELSAGLPSSRFAPRIPPVRVAHEVAAAIRRPGGERWVPKVGRLLPLARALPTGVRRFTMSMVGVRDPILGAAGSSERLVYEQRIAAPVARDAVINSTGVHPADR
jgi:NAD(P)-dependent dehydrogenase (short-subunit alcohol dehydrogenase family)